ncbi:hypothetical protein [Spiroplasma endosymbiont of Notiophilus biguttatus]|uniref:hypothetical protein n=1 Tax=Spiroplasma endosymbiont of Notiophilus biguttatus TaxID=3066285 RepID=UPI00313E64DF
MNNENIITNTTSSFQTNEEVVNKQSKKTKKRISQQTWYQKNKQKIKEYKQRPEVKARKKKYDQKRYQLIKEKQQKYAQRPEIKTQKQNAFLALCTIF